MKNILFRLNTLKYLFILALGMILWTLTINKVFHFIFNSEAEQLSRLIKGQFREEIYLNNYELSIRTLKELENQQIITCAVLFLRGESNLIPLINRRDESQCARRSLFIPFWSQQMFEVKAVNGQDYSLSYSYGASVGLATGYWVSLFAGIFLSISIIIFAYVREKSIALSTQAKLQAAKNYRQLANQVAHDIKSPLSALRIAIKQIDTHDKKNAKEIIGHTAKRIEIIAEELLLKSRQPDISSHDHAESEKEINAMHRVSAIIHEVDVVEAVRVVFAEKKMFTEDLVKIEIIKRPIRTIANQSDFQRVISNIIDNSIDATSGSGWIHLSLDKDSESAIIEVRDNGKGVPKEILPLLFQEGASFGKQRGNGLGLFHAKQIIESWGGEINLYSNCERGTTVTIKLPLL